MSITSCRGHAVTSFSEIKKEINYKSKKFKPEKKNQAKISIS